SEMPVIFHPVPPVPRLRMGAAIGADPCHASDEYTQPAEGATLSECRSRARSEKVPGQLLVQPAGQSESDVCVSVVPDTILVTLPGCPVREYRSTDARIKRRHSRPP